MSIERNGEKFTNLSQEPIHHQVFGEGPFYLQVDYADKLVALLKKDIKELQPIWRWQDSPRFSRWMKRALSTLSIFGGLRKIGHYFTARYAIVPSSNRNRKIRKELKELRPSLPTLINKNANADNIMYIQRFAILVNGKKMDVIIGVNPQRKNRWILNSFGNIGVYEKNLHSLSEIKKLSDQLQGNFIVCNPIGIGESQGRCSRKALINSYKAILSFLQDQQGLNAKEIVWYGHSLGGALQGEIIRTSPSSLINKKIIVIKSRTLSSMSKTVQSLSGKLSALLIKIFGWNIKAIPSHGQASLKEIVLQTAKVKRYTHLKPEEKDKILDDDVIFQRASYGRKRLKQQALMKHHLNSIIVGVPERHNDTLSDETLHHLVQDTKRLLERN